MRKGTHNDITGQRRNRLVAVSYVGQNRFRQAIWIFRCDCSKEFVTTAAKFLNDHTKSCGCLNIEQLKTGDRQRVHGLDGTGVYRSWCGMIYRCYDPKCKSYCNYGGRGIRVCEFLRATPENLRQLLGDRGKGISVDRIDNEKHYTCGKCAECLKCGYEFNVRWATAKVQANNTRRSVRVSVDAKKITVEEFSSMTGIPASTIYRRLNRGLDLASFADRWMRKNKTVYCAPNLPWHL